MYFISFKFKLFINYILFWHIGNQDVDKLIQYEANTIRGTQKLHSIKTKTYQIVFGFDRRNESYFFSICIYDIEST